VFAHGPEADFASRRIRMGGGPKSGTCSYGEAHVVFAHSRADVGRVNNIKRLNLTALVKKV